MPAAEEEKRGGFLSHALIYGLGSVSLQLVSIVVLPLYAWKLSVDEYGLLQLLYRIGDMINMCLMVNGTRMAVLAFWGKADSDHERNQLAPTVVLLVGAFLIVGGLIIVGLSGILADWLKVDDWRLLACGVFAIVLQGTTVIPLTFMQARLESKPFAVYSSIIAISQLTLVAIALCLFDAGIWGVVLAFALNNLIFGLWLNFRELTRTRSHPSRQQLRDIVRFSLPFIPSGICYFLLHNGDQFFLVEYHDTFVVGIYALAYRLAKGVATFASQPLCQVWSAAMYEAYKQPDRAAVFGRAITRITGAMVFACLGLALFRHEAIQLLGATKFAGATEVLPILLLAHVFLLLANLADGAIYVTRRTDLKPYIAAVAMTVMVAAYWLLIPRYAAWGGAVATLLGFVVLFLATAIATRRLFAIQYEVGRLTVLISAAAVAFVLGELLPLGWQFVAVRLAIFAATPTVLWYLNFVQPAEKAYVRATIRKWLGVAVQRLGWGNA